MTGTRSLKIGLPIIVMGTLVFLTVSSVVTAQEVSGPYRLADTDYGEYSPDIAMDSEGGFHVIYYAYDFDDHRGWLEYLKVSPSGSVLKGPLTLSNPNTEYVNACDIIVDSSDRVHVVFSPRQSNENPDLYYAQLTKDGDIEVPAKELHRSADHQSYPSVDVDNAGNVYIAWFAGGETTKIMWMKLSSDGSVLRTAQSISDEAESPEMNYFPRICVSPTGQSHVVWSFYRTENNNARSTVYYTSLTSTGAVDVEPTEVLASQFADYWGVKAALDSDMKLHLAFIIRDAVRSDALGYARLDEDGNVEDEQRLDDPPLSGEALEPDIAVNTVDDIFVVYQRMTLDYLTDWNIHITISGNGGSTWDLTIQLTDDDSCQNSAVAAGTNLVGVVYGYNHDDVHMVIVGEDIPNEPPVASLIASPQDPDVHQEVEFDGRDSRDPDPNDHVERYFFDYGDGNNSGWVDTPTVIYQTGYARDGTYTASLRVRDTYGLESENMDTVSIQVGSTSTNFQPLAKLLVIPNTADIGEEIVFNGGTSVDRDGSVAQFNFDFGDGTTTGWVTQDYQYHSYDSEGVYTAVLVVKDNKGSESEPASKRVTIVHVNEVPTATIVSIEPSPVMEGEEVTLTGTGEDLDGTIETFTWESDKDGIFGTTAIVTISTLSVGSHTIAFKVRDDEDVWSGTVTDTLVVLKNQDFILDDQTRKREVKTDGEMHFRVVYTDLEGDPPTLRNLLYAKGNVWKEVRLLEEDTDDQDFTDGKEYYYIRTFGPGTWEFAFEFENERNLRQTTDVKKFEVVEDPLFPIPAGGTPGVLLAMLVVALAMVLRRHVGRVVRNPPKP